MDKVSFGFWHLPLLLRKEVIKLQLQQKDIDSEIQESTQIHLNMVAQTQDYNVVGDRTTQKFSDLQLGQLLSSLLKYGVIVASTVVLIGGVLYLIRHGAEPAAYQFFKGQPSQFCSPGGVVQAVLAGSREATIQLGLLLLVAIPILRVIISLLAFLRQKDYTYVVITSIVLTALIYSLVGAYY
jgi:uncharacterized membrane protein